MKLGEYGIKEGTQVRDEFGTQYEVVKRYTKLHNLDIAGFVLQRYDDEACIIFQDWDANNFDVITKEEK